MTTGSTDINLGLQYGINPSAILGTGLSAPMMIEAKIQMPDLLSTHGFHLGPQLSGAVRWNSGTPGDYSGRNQPTYIPTLGIGGVAGYFANHWYFNVDGAIHGGGVFRPGITGGDGGTSGVEIGLNVGARVGGFGLGIFGNIFSPAFDGSQVVKGFTLDDPKTPNFMLGLTLFHEFGVRDELDLSQRF